MAGAAAARTLTRAPGEVGPFEVSLARPADEAGVRQLLRDAPLGGAVGVSLEREPGLAAGAPIYGDEHQILVARERCSGQIAAIASRSVRDAFLNGHPSRLGYLGEFRVAPGVRASRGLLDAGFAACQALHERGNARVYLVSIVADNHAARRLFAGSRSAFAPRFVRVGGLTTLMLPPSRGSRLRGGRPRGSRLRGRAGLEIHIGQPELLGEIAACLQRNGERYQFAPRWSSTTLCTDEATPGLRADDFLLATRGSRIVGCVACWDQRRYKQVVIRRYPPRLLRWRPLINRASPWVGIPPLPAPGSPIDFAYLSHLAVDGDSGEVAVALLAAALKRLSTDLSCAVTAMPDESPLLAACVGTFRHRAYRSDLYLAYWEDGEAIAGALDGRMAYPEVATL